MSVIHHHSHGQTDTEIERPTLRRLEAERGEREGWMERVAGRWIRKRRGAVSVSKSGKDKRREEDKEGKD